MVSGKSSRTKTTGNLVGIPLVCNRNDCISTTSGFLRSSDFIEWFGSYTHLKHKFALGES